MQYSGLDIRVVPEGRYTVGADKVFVPHMDGAPKPKGTLFVSVNPIVIRAEGEIILVDCGLGEQAENRTMPDFIEALQAIGVQREEVTKVLLSHLHFDHAGGAIYTVDGVDYPTFPDADYILQMDEKTAPYTGRSATFRDRVVACLDQHGQALDVTGSGWVNEWIEYEHTGGHTRDHQIFRFHAGGRTVIFGGDVLPSASQINRKFLAKYDHDPERAKTLRETLAQEALTNGSLLLFYHGTHAAAAFVDDYSTKKGYTVNPIKLNG